ncbi:hypothetical protein HK101_004358 [Irineochytrium annulatum]|nr:hypothetical protein HK101_004358 [Irineochytrium annulatum]
MSTRVSVSAADGSSGPGATPTDAGTDVYLRVQLPTDSTTVIMVKSDMTMWEILNVICVKKELMPSQHSLKMHYTDSREEPSSPERTLASYQNLERVVVMKNPGVAERRKDLRTGVDRRPSVVMAPSSRQTTMRVSPLEFPKTVTDQGDLTARIAHMQKHGEYQTTTKKTPKAIKSLSMLLFKRSSADVGAMEAFDGSNATPGSLTPSEDNRSSTSLGHEVLEELEAEDNAEVESLVSDKPDETSSLSVNNAAESATNVVETSAVSISDQSKDVPSLSISHSQSTTSFSDNASLKSSINIAESAASKTSFESIGMSSENFPPLVEGQVSDRASLQERRLRRRAVSTPTPSGGGAALRRNTYRKNRPRSNTDGILQGSSDIFTESQQLANDKAAVVRVTLPNFQCITIRVPLDQRMDNILDYVCQNNNIDPENYTLTLNEKAVVVEMERTIGYYIQEMGGKLTDLLVAPGEKFYRTRCINEDGKDVMILEMTKEGSVPFFLGESRVVCNIADSLKVMAGTPEKLIERLTDDEEKDKAFMDTMLLTFRSFMKPDDFFQHLLDRFNCVPPLEPTPEDLAYFEKMKAPVQKGVFNAIAWWVEYHWHDFAVSPELRKDMEEFVKEMKHSPFEKEWLKNLISVQDTKYEEMFSYYKTVERRGKTMESMFLELTPEDLSQQLCIHDFKLFRNIHPIEFLNQIWKKDDDGCPCLTFFSERFDKESYWVATEVVSQKDMKKRVKVLTKFILMAKACQEYHNFFSMFALVMGINLTPVTRLKKTWEALGDKTRKVFSEVEEMCDPSRNFKNYNQALSIAKPPMNNFNHNPEAAIYLKDLTFINDGNPSNVQGLINFEKLRMMGKRVKDIMSLASTEYKFPPIPEMQNYLAKPPIEKSMTRLKEMSLECEK